MFGCYNCSITIGFNCTILIKELFLTVFFPMCVSKKVNLDESIEKLRGSDIGREIYIYFVCNYNKLLRQVAIPYLFLIFFHNNTNKNLLCVYVNFILKTAITITTKYCPLLYSGMR